MNETYTVNRKQFHFLVAQFLAQHRLIERWFEQSIEFKKRDKYYANLYQKYGMKWNDDFSTHLYKCIDLYMGETEDYEYDHCIYGFFQYTPSGGGDFDSWVNFWRDICLKFSSKYYFVKFE